jgi:5-hydroxyisourate hydrolase-like protein (transthyretin family)
VLFSATAFAASISGVVTNRTTGKPAAGDDVTLIKLAQGMQEAGSTRTDARGRFTLDVPDDGIHLVRVTHDKANYFQAVEPGARSVDVDVFTAAAKVDGVSTEAEVLHVQTDPSGGALNVVASFFVKNVSSPPKTQFGERAFDFYLPPGAIVDGSVALGPGRMSMPVKSPPVPLGDAPDHYAFLFPVRPCVGDAAQDSTCGETRFQVTFKLPYTGSLAFQPKVATPTDTLAVMLPKSMAFRPASGAAQAYVKATDETTAQAFVARNVQPSEPLGFTVSGTGQLPRDTQAGGSAQATADPASGTAGTAGGDLTPAEASARQRADTRPGVGLNNPLDSEGDLEPWAKYKWWILGLLGIALAGGAGVMLKGGPTATAAAAVAVNPAGPSPTGPGNLLDALKEELFALETDRLAGTLAETEYAELKSALDVVLRRAIARSTAAAAGTGGAPAGIGSPAGGIGSPAGASNLT